MTTRLGSNDQLRIGAILHDARRRQGIEIDVVEERTKIRAKYLRALEEEDWEVLPGPAYARGFIRAYADLLGLDSEVLVDEFRRRYEEPMTSSRERGLRERRIRDDPGRRPVSRLLVLAAVVASALILLLVVGITSGGEDGDTGGSERGKRGKSGRQQSGGGSNGARSKHVPEKATVKLVARSDVEACLVNNHRQVLVPDQLLIAGTEDGPYVSKRFRVELEPATAQIMVNGEPAKVPTRSSEPAAYTVTSRRVRSASYTGALCQ